MSQNRRGTLVAEHSVAWTLDAQRDVFAEVRSSLLEHQTRHIHTRDPEGVGNTLMVLRFLHDLETKVHELQNDGDEEQHLDAWSALDYFCRPWVVTKSKNDPLLCLQEHVPPLNRALCGVCWPVGLSLGALGAWVTMQSPEAFCRLHVRRIVGNRLRPTKVNVDSTYRLACATFEVEAALKEVMDAPRRICDVVKGEIPSTIATPST